MKRYQFIFILFFSFFFSCRSSYVIVNDSKPTNPLNKYNKIHIDWLDLKEKDWEVHGYATAEEWKNEINKQNVDGLFQYIQKLLPSKEYSFAESSTDENLSDMELRLKFSDIDIKPWRPFGPPFALNVKIHFIDIKTNEEIYSVSLKAQGLEGWNFEQILNNAIYNLASFITEKL